MESESHIARIEPELLPVFEELRTCEPIFHRNAFGVGAEDFARRMAPDYWEVGASGRRYNREFILKYLDQHPPVDAETAGWACSDFALRQLGPETYLLTYRLDQKGRETRRATIWQQTEGGWQILYHQGTIVGADDEGALPSKRAAPRQ
jgi:hypothetical protein